MNPDLATVRSAPLGKPNLPNRPRSGDAVLGDHVGATQGSLVLGGIDRLRQQLSSPQQQVRLRAMQAALDRGSSGWALLIQTPFREQVEQLWLLETGVALWNHWRQRHLSVLVQFDRVDFSGADLRSIDWRNTSLHQANLVDIYLNQADLQGASFCKADLTGANLQGANLHGAELSGVELRGANLQDANFTDAYLGWADLTAADIRRTNFSHADLRNACLRGTYLKGADFTGATMSDGSCF